jgi:hypothetical protein
MIKLLKYRAALISAMFALFGSALTNLLVVKEMGWYYTGLAALIALVVNLLVAFLLKGKWSIHFRNNIKAIAFLLFLGMLFTVYLHTKYFLECTFQHEEYNGEGGYYIKGDVYTKAALQYKAENPFIVSDEELVEKGFSVADKDKVWTPDSIKGNTLKLISSYSFCVIFFVGIISILLEVLIGHYGRTTIRTMEPV